MLQTQKFFYNKDSSKMTYWEKEGKYQELAKKLGDLIPSHGRCNNDKLELYRVCRNAYYDVYNNGACNPSRFAELRDRINDRSAPALPFNAQESDEFRNWLNHAADENREFYLFNKFDEDPQEKHILDLFERLVDSIILHAADLI